MPKAYRIFVAMPALPRLKPTPGFSPVDLSTFESGQPKNPQAITVTNRLSVAHRFFDEIRKLLQTITSQSALWHSGHVTNPPLLRQPAGGGGSEDGLAEALEDGEYAVEVFAAGVYPREDHVELVGDAFLLVEGSKGKRNRLNIICTHICDSHPFPFF